MKKPSTSPEDQKTPFPTREDNPRDDDHAPDSAQEKSFPASDPASITPGRREPAAEPDGRPHAGRKGEKKPPSSSEDALDEGLEESFPASDPVSIGTKKPIKPA